MSTPLVGVLIGSRSEFHGMRKGLEMLRVMGVPYEFEVFSPERTPERVIDWVRRASDRGIQVILVSAGPSGVLASLAASATSLPVIAVPVETDNPRAQEPPTSLVAIPPATPVGYVGVNGSEGAAELATRILALQHPDLNRVLEHQKHTAALRQESAVLDLRGQYPDLTDPISTIPDTDLLHLSELETDPGPSLRAAIRRAAEDREKNKAASGESSPALAPALAPTAPVGKPPAAPIAPQEPAPARKVAADDVDTEEEEPPKATGKTKGRGVAEVREIELPSTPKVDAKVREESKGKKPSSEESGGAPRKKDDTRASQKSAREIERELAAASKKKTGRRPLADRLFRVNSESPDVEVIEHAMFTLLEGGIVALPTDTVYGIAVDATNAEAVDRLYRLKGRDRQKAMAVLVHNQEMLSRLVTRFPDRVEELMDAFWPGSLTMIFPKPIGVLAGVSATRSIGVRIPDHTTALALISMVARPLATTSANFAGQPPATTADEVVSIFGDDIDCIIDGGPAPGTVASTVLSVVQTPYQILRKGAVSREALQKILGDLLDG